MKNPYEILGINQNADKKEINRAKFRAMKEHKYTPSEINLAERQLLDPAKRLAADFMFFSKLKAWRPLKIEIGNELIAGDIKELDENALDSLE